MKTLFLRIISLTPFLLFGENFLSDMTLQKAESIAISSNKELLISKEDSTQAKERTKQAFSKWLPSISYQGQFHKVEKKEAFLNIFNPEDSFTASQSGYRSILQLDQPLFSTDLIFNLKSKQIEEEALDFQRASTLNELLLDVRQNYYRVVASEINLGVQRENIHFLTYALELEEKKLIAGSSTSLEVNRSKVAVASAISLYYSSLKNLKTARNALILTLGVDPLLEPELSLDQKMIPIESIPEIAVKLQNLESRYDYFDAENLSSKDFQTHINALELGKTLVFFTEKELLHCLQSAFTHRPDLQKNKLDVGVANQNLGEKKGRYLPKLDGFARYSYNDAYLGPHPFKSQNYYWSGGIVLKWNLFDGLLREHEVNEARSLKESYKIKYNKTCQKVEIEIRDSLYALEEALLTYLSSTKGVILAEQSRFQAAEKLEFGKIPPIEYRDSVNLLLQSKNQKTKASLEVVNTYYQLRYAMGTDSLKTF